MKHLKLFFVVLLYGALLLPAAQMSFNFLPTLKLNGIKMPKNKPELNLPAILDGSYQAKAEKWMMRRNGVWGAMVRADNELNLRLFKQLSASYKTTSHAGENGYFFQSFYLGSFNRINTPSVQTLENAASNLKTLQDLLAVRGIPMILLLSTNAIALYPEIVPDAFVDPTRETRENSYQIMKPLLDKYGVNYLDGHQYLLERKKQTPFRFFAPTASHWNDAATCLLTRELLHRLEALTGKKFISFGCDSINFKERPKDYDLDLVRICNVWDPKRTFQLTPYVQAQKIKDGEITKPKLLFVGTSFLWSTLRYLDRYRITRSNRFFFYFDKVRKWPEGTFRKFDRGAVDWTKSVFSNDAIILEINMAVVQNVGHGFIEEAIRQLGGTPLPVNAGDGLREFLPKG